MRQRLLLVTWLSRASAMRAAAPMLFGDLSDECENAKAPGNEQETM